MAKAARNFIEFTLNNQPRHLEGRSLLFLIALIKFQSTVRDVHFQLSYLLLRVQPKGLICGGLQDVTNTGESDSDQRYRFSTE